MYVYIILPPFTLVLIIFLVSNHYCSCSRDAISQFVQTSNTHTHITPPRISHSQRHRKWLRSDEELRLIDVTPLSLGLQTAGGFMTTVLFPLLQGLGMGVRHRCENGRWRVWCKWVQLLVSKTLRMFTLIFEEMTTATDPRIHPWSLT